MAYTGQAKAAGDARFAGEESSIKTQQQLAAIQAQAAQAALNQWGTTGAQAINQSFEGLLSDMAANRGRAMDVINQQVGRVGQGYQDVAAGNLAVRDESRQYLENLLGNFGMGGDVVASVQSPMEELTQRLVERNTRYGQDAQAALGNWGAQHDVLYGDAEVNARGAQAFSQEAFQSQLGNLLAQAQNAQREREIQFASALQALAAQRGGFEVDYATQLAQRDSDRNLQLAQMQQQASARQAELDARAQEFNISRQDRANSEAWEREKFNRTFGLDERQQDFAEWQALMDSMNQGTDYSGISGMRTYAQDVGDPTVANLALQHLNRASRTPEAMANPGSIGQIAERYVTQPQAQYGRIGGGSGRKADGSAIFERPRNYEDILNAIAIGSGRF